jgi:hypothetical protein
MIKAAQTPRNTLDVQVRWFEQHPRAALALFPHDLLAGRRADSGYAPDLFVFCHPAFPRCELRMLSYKKWTTRALDTHTSMFQNFLPFPSSAPRFYTSQELAIFRRDKKVNSKVRNFTPPAGPS